MITELVDHFGWGELATRIRIRCFSSQPSVGSSSKFLRRTPWARAESPTFCCASARAAKRREDLYGFMLARTRPPIEAARELTRLAQERPGH
jgi:uncharacterized protein (DUF2132 family)